MTVTVPIVAADGAKSTVTLPAPTVTSGGAGFGQAVMAAPSGYTNLIYRDTFLGTTLDLTKWSPNWGFNGILWNNFGKLGYDPNGFPYTGPNTPVSTESELFAASQVKVNNGLTITLIPNTAPLNPGGVHYQCISGCINSVAKPGHGPGESANFVLPTTGKWLVQIRAKVSDMSHGISPMLWFLPGYTSGGNELDSLQGGLNPSNPNFCPFGCQYFGPTNSGNQTPNVGVDSTLAFHTYGCEVNWSTNTCRAFFDGKQVWTHTETLAKQAYAIQINLAAWLPGLGWATGYNGGTGTLQVAEVQAYSA
jgi:hypothetical protein